ncbi:MAG: AsmA-like C-terminal region-containing protein [Pseudomonadota bacterium]
MSSTQSDGIAQDVRARALLAVRTLWGHGWARHVMVGLGALILLWFLIFGAVSLRLVFGDQRLDWLAPQVVNSLNQRLPEQLEADARGLSLSRSDGGIHLELQGLVVRDETGARVFKADKSRIGFSLAGFMTGNIEARSVGLIEPVIAFNARSDTTAGDVIRPQEMVAAAFSVLRVDGGLRELRLEDAVLAVPGTNARLEGVNIKLFPEDGTSDSIILEANGAPENGQPWAIGGRFARRADGGVSYEFGFADIVPDLLLGENSAFGLSSAISGQVAVATFSDQQLADASYTISLAPGEVRLPGNIALPIEAVEISGRYDISRRVIAVTPSRLDIAGSKALFAGEFSIPGKDSLLYGSIPVSFAFRDLDILIGEDRGRIPLDAVIIEALYDTYGQQASIRRLDFLGGRTSVSMIGSVARAPLSPAIRLRGSTADMSVLELEHLWPAEFAKNTRRWLLRHVRSGELTNANLTVDIPGGVLAGLDNLRDLPPSMARLDFEVKDLVSGYFRELPDMRIGETRGRMTLSTFELETRTPGQILLPSGREVTVTKGRYRVADTRPRPATAEIGFSTTGDVDAHLELLDFDPLRVAQGQGIDPSDTGGTMESDVGFRITLQPGNQLEDVNMEVDATFADLVVPAGDRRIRNAALEVTIEGGILRATGQGELNGVAADIDITEVLYGDKSPSLRSVSMTLNAADRRKLGLDFGGIITGSVPVTITDRRGGRRELDVDLKPVRLLQPSMGLDKPAGVAARLRAEVIQSEEGGDRIESLELNSRELRLRGEGNLNEEGRISRLRLSEVMMQDGDDARVDMVRTDRGLEITIRAARLNMRRIIDSVKRGAATGGGSDPTPVWIKAEIAEAPGYNGSIMRNLSVDLAVRGDAINGMNMIGYFGERPVELRVERDGNAAPVLQATTTDGGRLLSWMDVYANMRGGQLRMRAVLGPERSAMRGRMTIARFDIERDPSIERIVRQTEDNVLAVQPEGQALTRGIGAGRQSFDRLEVDFDNRAGVFRFSQGVISGPAVGATFGGTLDLAQQRINVSGTYVPLYVVNNLLGQIPVLGTILAGGSNEGLIGVTFAVRGSLRQPSLIINPVSAVTPGVFRLIFGGTGALQGSAGVPGRARSNGNGAPADPLVGRSN